MNDKSFFSDVLRDGALLGLVMALLCIFKNYLQMQVDMPITKMYLLLSLATILSIVLFVWMLYRFLKRRSQSADEREGFTYGQGLIYAFVLSLLTGIVVGLANTLFIAVVGYENYVESLVANMDNTVDFVASLSPAGAAIGDYEEMMSTLVDKLESSSRPTVFDNIFASLNNYITWGTLLGLILARVVRREPKF